MLLKLENLICAHAGFAKFIYKMLDISSQQKKNNNNNTKTYLYTKINMCPEKLEYHNRFFPFALHCTFTFLCLLICWNLWNLFQIGLRTIGFN